MKQMLHEYLVEYHSLPMPGIGVLQSRIQPARYDVADRLFQAPAVQIDFAPWEEGESTSFQHLVGYLSVRQNLSEEEAFELFQKFVHEAKMQLETTGKLEWSPFGHFFLNAEKHFSFEVEKIVNGFAPLVTDRVIHEGASHDMMVGDTATTTTQMELLLSENKEATDRWWLLPLLIALSAFAVIIWKKFSS